MRFIKVLETYLGKEAIIDMLPMQNGDVTATYADTTALEQTTGFKPHTSIEEGLQRFVGWYREYYQT